MEDDENNDGRINVLFEFEEKGKIKQKVYSMNLNIKDKINFEDYFYYNKIQGELQDKSALLAFHIVDKIYLVKFDIKESSLKVQSVETIDLNNVSHPVISKGFKMNSIIEVIDGYVLLGEYNKEKILFHIFEGDKFKFMLRGKNINNHLKVNNNKCAFAFGHKMQDSSPNTLKYINLCDLTLPNK